MSHLLSCCFQTFLPLSFLNVHIQSTHHINAGQLQQNQNVNELFIFCNTKYRKKLIYHKVLLLTNSTFQSLFEYLLCLSLVFETVFIPLINIGLQSTKKKSSFFNNMLMEFFLHIQTISRNIQNLNSMLFL